MNLIDGTAGNQVREFRPASTKQGGEPGTDLLAGQSHQSARTLIHRQRKY
jgi:hypothetical protein